MLKETSMFRDPTRLLEIIKAEELQAKNLLTLKLEEYQTLRRAEILSEDRSNFLALLKPINDYQSN